MATYSAGVALAFDYEAVNGTTGSFSPSGDDLALITFISSLNFGGAPNITDCKYGGSGGTSLTEVSTDYSWYSGNGRLVSYEAAPGPSGSTTSFGEWDSNPLQSAIASLAYSGVDATTPVEGATDASGSTGGVTTVVASVTVTGCTAGQTVIACITANSDSVNLSAFSATAATPLLRHSDVTGTFLGIAVVEKVASGSSVTLDVNVNCASSATLTWAARGLRVNDAAGGDSVISAAAGAAAASAMAGSSTASTAITAAAGAATSSAITGSATSNATQSAAAGVATTSAAAGSSTASAAESAAAGAATTSALAGSSTAVSSFVAAAGVATASTLSSDLGASTITQADGVATASSMAGSSLVVASFVPATGAATAGSLAGSDASAPAAATADGASPMQRRRRRPVDDSPVAEFVKPAPVEPEPAEPNPETAPQPAPEPAQIRLPEAIRASIQKLKAAPEPKARSDKAQKRLAKLEAELAQAISRQEEEEDDLAAINAAVELLLS